MGSLYLLRPIQANCEAALMNSSKYSHDLLFFGSCRCELQLEKVARRKARGRRAWALKFVHNLQAIFRPFLQMRHVNLVHYLVCSC